LFVCLLFTKLPQPRDSEGALQFLSELPPVQPLKDEDNLFKCLTQEQTSNLGSLFSIQPQEGKL